jgi:hypothetical protein
MTEADWLNANLSRPMLEWAHRNRAVASSRKARLFAVGCCRLVWGEIEGVGQRELVELVEREADCPSGRVDIRLTRQVPIALAGDPMPDLARFLLYGILEPTALHAADYAAYCAPEFNKPGVDSRSVCVLLRDIFGNPFRPVAFAPKWKTDTALSLAKQMYDSRDFSAMPILADALQDAGCDNEDILSHCRGEGPHVRGCWVVDLVLGKE